MTEDLINKKFGKWTVLEYAGIDKHRKKTWKCKCICGNIQNKSGNILKSGRTTQCKKCRNLEQIIDLTNRKFGKWTVIKKTKKDLKNNCLVWECICECGKKSNIRGKCLLSNKSKQCIECANKEMESKDILPKYIFNRIKKSAKERKKEFSLTKEYLEQLFLKQEEKCALSGEPISIKQNFTKKIASLDRIDSEKGYIEKNVQWVDKKINFMKQNLSEKEFFLYCERIINYKNCLKTN